MPECLALRIIWSHELMRRLLHDTGSRYRLRYISDYDISLLLLKFPELGEA